MCPLNSDNYSRHYRNLLLGSDETKGPAGQHAIFSRGKEVMEIEAQDFSSTLAGDA